MHAYCKIGEGIGRAYFRVGLAEFRAALNPFESPIVQPTDYGMPGMAIPSEAASARLDGPSVSERDSAVDDRLQSVQIGRDDRGHDDREPPEIDRE